MTDTTLHRPADSADQISDNIGGVLASIRRLIAQDETAPLSDSAPWGDSAADTPVPAGAQGDDPSAPHPAQPLILSPDALVARSGPAAGAVNGLPPSPMQDRTESGRAAPACAPHAPGAGRPNGGTAEPLVEERANGRMTGAAPVPAEAAPPQVPVMAASLAGIAPAPSMPEDARSPAPIGLQKGGGSIGLHPFAPPQDLPAGGPLLRSLLRNVVRQELQGELGSHLEHNLRQMIRQEIARTLNEAIELSA